MNLATAQWLLEGTHAFQKDPKLKEWNGLQREYFVWLLTSIFKVETFIEAVSLLEKVVSGELTAPSLPPDLKKLIEDWFKSQEQKAEIQKEAMEKVAQFIAKQQALLIEQQRLAAEKPLVIPLAEAAKEAVKEVPKKREMGPPPPPEAFPGQIIEKLAAEEEGVAFVSIFTLLQSKVTFSFAKKAALSPIVKTIQFVDKVAGEELPVEVAKTVPEERQTVSEFREVLHQGLTAKDIETSIEGFQEAGVPPDHPKLVELEQKRIRLESYEKSHLLLTGILKQYHEFSKITGRRQIYLPEIKAYLPRLSPALVWVKRRGYSFRLRQALTQIGTGLRLYRKLPIAPEKTIIHFSLPETLTKIVTFGKIQSFQAVKTAVYQKAIKPILIRLGKTAIGKGLKKATAWILTKLGLAALPEPISKVVLVASFVWDAIKLGWGLIKKGLRRLSDKPIETIILAAILFTIGLFAPIALPIKLLLLGAGLFLSGVGFISGLAGWAGGIISGAGSLLSGAFSTVGGFISSLTTISLPSSLPILAVGGAVGATTGLTILALSAVSTAFMLPVSPFRYTGEFPPSIISPTCIDLADLFNESAQNQCIPTAILMAISQMEAAGVWGWSCEEVARFSTPNWWENATQEELRKGYCYDTCAATGLCQNTTVMGPMQFEENTWKGIMPGYSLMDRCRLDLSLLAAAKKIKANSETGPGNCDGWGEEIVRWKVAYRYCGSCGTEGCKANPNPQDSCSSACGYDYCGNVWILYQQYAAQ